MAQASLGVWDAKDAPNNPKEPAMTDLNLILVSCVELGAMKAARMASDEADDRFFADRAREERMDRGWKELEQYFADVNGHLPR